MISRGQAGSHVHTTMIFSAATLSTAFLVAQGALQCLVIEMARREGGAGGPETVLFVEFVKLIASIGPAMVLDMNLLGKDGRTVFEKLLVLKASILPMMVPGLLFTVQVRIVRWFPLDTDLVFGRFCATALCNSKIKIDPPRNCILLAE